MAAAQLSLFADSESQADKSACDSSADDTPARKRRKRAAASPQPVSPPSDAPDLFALLPAETAAVASPAPAAVEIDGAIEEPLGDTDTPEEAVDTAGEDAGDEDCDDGRIRFDPNLWHLRSESGDFIHIRTGEIRSEDDFRFTASPFDDRDPPRDDWDVAQVSDNTE